MARLQSVAEVNSIAAMHTIHIHKALKSANMAEVSAKTGVSVRRLYQLREDPFQLFNITLSTWVKLDAWAKEQGKAASNA
jgi:hypothetical protein